MAIGSKRAVMELQCVVFPSGAWKVMDYWKKHLKPGSADERQPLLKSGVSMAGKKFAWVCKSCRRRNGANAAAQCMQSLSYILCWNQTKPTGIFLANPALQMADLLARREAMPAISACTASPAWTENKDLIVSVYLKRFVKQFFTRSWGKKNICVLICDLCLFVLKFGSETSVWLNPAINRQFANKIIACFNQNMHRAGRRKGLCMDAFYKMETCPSFARMGHPGAVL